MNIVFQGRPEKKGVKLSSRQRINEDLPRLSLDYHSSFLPAFRAVPSVLPSFVSIGAYEAAISKRERACERDVGTKLAIVRGCSRLRAHLAAPACLFVRTGISRIERARTQRPLPTYPLLPTTSSLPSANQRKEATPSTFTIGRSIDLLQSRDFRLVSFRKVPFRLRYSVYFILSNHRIRSLPYVIFLKSITKSSVYKKYFLNR